MSHELLLFEIDDAVLAVPTIHVREVIRAAALFPLVEHSKLVEGGLNLRGEIVPVVDGRAMMSRPSRPMSPGDHIIVLAVDRRLVAIRVDRALELTRIDGETVDDDVMHGQLIDRVINTQRGPTAVVTVSELLEAAVPVAESAGGDA